MIIDAHAHIYPQKIAGKATEVIGEFYDIKMSLPAGTAERLLENGKSAGIDRFVVHSVATTAHQVDSINAFILSECEKHPEFIGFMTLHQDLSEEEIFERVESCVKAGIRGIKLHPDFQKFSIDDESVFKFYRAAGEFSLPILFHTGDNRYDYSKPYKMATVAKLFPKNRFIGAHFGGYRCWDELDVYKGLSNVWFDTSSSLPFLDVDFATSLIKKFGTERFFFGTDFPMWKADEELLRFMKLKLTEREKETILGENFLSFIKK